VIVRSAVSDDHAAIAVVVAAAFGRPDEALIVERVRSEGQALAELVAETGGDIMGHILFSRMTCDCDLLATGLAPLSVTPSRQGAGIGSRLTREGLEACRRLGAGACVVLGAPGYYGRFGFVTAGEHIVARYSGLPAFQALELQPGALSRKIVLAFPAAFD
jgi:putative acetyltransferase